MANIDSRPAPTRTPNSLKLRAIMADRVFAHYGVIQQLREAFPDEPTHRYLIYDNDSIFSTAVTHAIRSFQIDPKRTAYRSPWQNGTAERFVGSVRRELLDHVIVFNDDHLRRLLREYVDYYNDERVHTSLSDAPAGRPVQSRPPERAKIVCMRLGPWSLKLVGIIQQDFCSKSYSRSHNRAAVPGSVRFLECSQFVRVSQVKTSTEFHLLDISTHGTAMLQLKSPAELAGRNQ